MTIRMPTLALGLLLIAGVAAAQPPIANGRQHQPTREEIDSRDAYAGGPRNSWAQSETDRLYDEIMRAAAPSAQR